MKNMKNFNPIFSLKNFRSFGEEGADFELAPITVLTGCNSSGKSSLVKALLLLSRHHNSNINYLKIFSKDLGLGQFDKIINNQSNDKEVVFSYNTWSDYLQEMVIVKKYFCAKKKDALGDGYLRQTKIERLDGTILYESDFDDDSRGDCKIESYSHNLFCFLLAVSYFYEHLKRIERKEQYNSERELENIKKKIKELSIDIESYNIGNLINWQINWRVRFESDFEDFYKKMYSLNENDIVKWYKDFPSNEKIECYLCHDAVNKFENSFVDEVFSPWFITRVEYINSSSALIRRIYSVEDGNKMCAALRQYNWRRINFNDNWIDESLNQPGRFLKEWIKNFQLADDVEIIGDDEGGIKVYLKNGDRKRLLADEGYGITQLVSLLLLIDNEINKKEKEKILWNNGKPDYEKSRNNYRNPDQIICVEEPENHLHPKFQSKLADMFVEAYKKYNIHFVIETHSEYLIRKLQVMIADKENELTSNDVSLNYVEKDENGISTNRKIEILDDGRLSEPFGPGFFDEADSLAMEIMKYKARRK